RPSDGLLPKSVAFVQCVGSRDAQLHREYCSRVCCGYALRMALRVSHEHPETRITLFYMDIQNFGKDFDRLYGKLKNGIRLIRSLPGDVYPSENERIAVSYYEGATRKTVTEVFDMVVLSVGMTPPPSDAFFRDSLGLVLNEDGFLRIPEGLKKGGIVMAGSADGPMDVSESISHAKRAALDMVHVLGVTG
ncbi:MAG: CoB--CoM heterodisulfide reductase iron-sulfur subunit A family protein, partial [Pseudomonadota bacterium]